MKVIHLLAVGKSIRTLKNQPSPFRMKEQIPAPKFGVENGKLGMPDGQILPNDRTGGAIDLSAIDDQNPVLIAPMEEPIVQELKTKKEKSSFVLPAWATFRGRFGRPAEKQGLVQTELSLETVRVI